MNFNKLQIYTQYNFHLSGHNNRQRGETMFKKLILAVLIIGGINWGLIGLLGFDLVAFIFGSSAALGARIAYIVVGVSAVCTLPQLFGSAEE